MTTPTPFTDAELSHWAQAHERSPLAAGIIRLLIERDEYKDAALDSGRKLHTAAERIAAQSELLSNRAARPGKTHAVQVGEVLREFNRAVAEEHAEGETD